MRIALRPVIVALSALALVAAAVPDASSQTGCCITPDNGGGTGNLPPLGCAYRGQMRIVDGLPVGTQILIDTEIIPLALVSANPGGSLGGTVQVWSGQLNMLMVGTGTLMGFNRNVVIPLPMGQETHSAPRVPFAPVQSFDELIWRLNGQLPFGDPDFDLLRITAGGTFALPGPGHTNLGQAGSSWAVDSFFDITYRIDFVGSPGSPLAGRSGSTTRIDRHSVCPGTVPVAAFGWSAVKGLYRD